MTTNPPQGWYPDPQGLEYERYFDGSEWTDKTRGAPSRNVVSSSQAPSSPEGARVAASARRVASTADTLAILFLFIGGVGAILLGGASLLAVGSYRHALHDVWPYTLTAAVVLLVNAVVIWVVLRFLGIVLSYVGLRSAGSGR